MAVEIEILDDPARACAAMLVGVAAGGGDIVLTGGSTAGAAYREFVEAVRTVGRPPESSIGSSNESRTRP